MNNISLVMAYYENPGMLAEHYRLIRGLDINVQNNLAVVIVDDGSPNNPAKPEELNGVPLQIYRIKKDVRWNQDAARNIGMQHMETNWALLTDIDHIVPERMWKAIMKRDLDRATAYTFNRVNYDANAPELRGSNYHFHPNTWLINRALFERVGGYDERFAGYYGTDSDFRDRLASQGGRIERLKEWVIRVPRTCIPDASTTTYLRKQPEDRVNIERIKAERALAKNPAPVRFRFKYERVYP